MKKYESDESRTPAPSSTALARQTPVRRHVRSGNPYLNSASPDALFSGKAPMTPANTSPRSFCALSEISDRTACMHAPGLPSAAALLLLAGLALIAGCSKPANGGGPPQYPPPDVTTATVEQKDVPIYGEWVANLDGYVNAQIQPQITGYRLSDPAEL